MPLGADASAIVIAEKVRCGALSAQLILENVLADIQLRNDSFNCFTRVLAETARKAAQVIDQKVIAGVDPGPLAGVPFGAKDLFDIAGIPTTAGSKLRLNAPAAKSDAEVVARLKRAGAILIGTLNMDEFAYGFATVNAHFGPTRNPHDPSRLAGGSSGGSAAAVAAGLVPIALGSDTNGSIRVPASLCGIWGIRPADNVIPMNGVFPFVEILDTVGPFARSLAELVLVYDLLSDSKRSFSDLQPRVARLDGWFERNADPEALQAVDAVMKHLGSYAVAKMPEAEAARSASHLMTAAQGGAFHLESLRHQAMDYDPAVRDRLLAGTMLPAGNYLKAIAFRKYYRDKIRDLFNRFDILIAPSTPVAAPRIDQATMIVDGKPTPARANLGLYTQPLSVAGIPIVSAPLNRPGRLPFGLQFATCPGREGMLFQLLSQLESDGFLGAHAPTLSSGT